MTDCCHGSDQDYSSLWLIVSHGSRRLEVSDLDEEWLPRLPSSIIGWTHFSVKWKKYRKYRDSSIITSYCAGCQATVHVIKMMYTLSGHCTRCHATVHIVRLLYTLSSRCTRYQAATLHVVRLLYTLPGYCARNQASVHVVRRLYT